MSTPIRVRGKNRRDKSGRLLCKSKPESKGTAGETSTRQEKNKPGRPLKLLKRLADDSNITSNSPTNSCSSSRLNSPSASSTISSNRTKNGAKRRRHRAQFSHLERLPPELLQTIFILSDNLTLPLVSPLLALSLSSHHVYKALCIRAFVVDSSKFEVDQELQSAVLKQPWFTMELVKMIEQELKNRNLPACSLLLARLPARLVRAPWTQEKLELLNQLLVYRAQVDWINTTIGEEAERGLRDAILEGCGVAVGLLMLEQVGIRPSTELLKFAMFQGGCREEIMRPLLVRGLMDERVGRPSRIDWEDAVIWHFALQLRGREESASDDDNSCSWLVEMLKQGLRTHCEVSGEHRTPEGYEDGFESVPSDCSTCTPLSA
ncbi:hypothetical protein FGG08_001493 [Glutinoglossum americanum]|uniref:Uncharacterized protein n=1 Tax=Glutinoglossum americanum TaxID=1670608 RepID=A0A9P8I854_9PEZI|nr:hypothetical protein FGG08_001493 [Glutinoglossum americanum]